MISAWLGTLSIADWIRLAMAAPQIIGAAIQIGESIEGAINDFGAKAATASPEAQNAHQLWLAAQRDAFLTKFQGGGGTSS